MSFRCGHPTTPENVTHQVQRQTRKDGSIAEYHADVCRICHRAARMRYYHRNESVEALRMKLRRQGICIALPPRGQCACGHPVRRHDPEDDLRCYAKGCECEVLTARIQAKRRAA